jgi:hypothetical protein
MREYYGAEWRRFRARLIETHGAKCSVCGNEPGVSRKGRQQYINLSHDLHDPRLPGVRLRCPRCHGKYDAKQSHALARRTRAKRAGQMWLSAELEFAPIPLADIPPEIRRQIERESTGDLFE